IVHVYVASIRLHTSFSRDWSSAVCSSELGGIRRERSGGDDRLPGPAAIVCPGCGLGAGGDGSGSVRGVDRGPPEVRRIVERHGRSEERRVGKEWRGRWWTDIVRIMRERVS